MSSLVIKVKYEETLRRFTVAVNGDQRMDLNMQGMRAKICSLFTLPPDADFRLTYVDEDDDVVDLVDDNDLDDVVQQGLDPLRITVLLNPDKSSQTGGASSGNLTQDGAFAQSGQSNIFKNVSEAIKSVEKIDPNAVQSNISKNVSEAIKSVEKIDPNVSDILKSVQEPLGHALSKLSLEMSSKAASASPVLAELFDGLSKIGQSYLNTSHSHPGSANMNGQDDVDNGPENSYGVRKPEVSADKGMGHNGNVISGPAKPSPIGCHPATEKGQSFLGPAGPSYLSEKGSNSGSVKAPIFSFGNVMKKNKDILEDTAENKFAGAGSIRYPKPQVSRPFRNWPFSYGKTLPSGECPFSGVPISSPYDHRSMSPIFHKGVRCDGCGILPITGPRFKSKVKYDYDLCNICFLRMGNDADYTRVDIPLSNRHPYSFKGFHGPVGQRLPMHVPGVMRPTGKHLRSKLDSRFIMDVNVMDGTTIAPSTPFTKIWRMRNNGTLPWYRGLRLICIGGDRFSPSDSVELEIPLDGLNVGSELDIAVDFIAPELPGRYISYWRMAEPSGHKFGQRIWVLVQVVASMDLAYGSSPILNLNLPPECTETSHPHVSDVSAETALDVEAGLPLSVENNNKSETEMEDLNFPINDDLLVDTDVVFPSPAAVPSVPVVASPSVPAALSTSVPVAASDNSVSAVKSSGLYPDVDASACSPLLSYPITFGGPSASTTVDQSNLHKAAAVNSLYPDVDANAYYKPAVSASLSSYPTIPGESSSVSSNDTNGKSKDDQHPEPVSKKTGVEGNLLRELEQMGFKQVDLNKEVLRMNEFDLERCGDDLCDVSEWDPILEELQEMGFHDKETNKKLLAKNNGRVTRVVMDLIAEEKA